MNFETLNDYIIWTTEGMGSSTAIDLGKKVIVVDSMIGPVPAQEWKNIIEKHFKMKIEILLITHAHGDHVLGSQAFKDCQIISSSQTRDNMEISKINDWTKDKIQEWLNSTKTQGTGLENLQLKIPTMIFSKELQFLGDERSLIFKHAGGHTNGSSFIWLPELEIIVAGDLLFNKIFPYAFDETVDPNKWLSALDEIIALEPKIIIPGHGKLGSLEDIIEFRDYVENVIKIIKQKLSRGLSPEEISNDESLPDYYSKGMEEKKRNSLKKWAEILSK